MTTSSTANSSINLVPNPNLPNGVVQFVDANGSFTYGFDPAAGVQLGTNTGRYTLNTTGVPTSSLKNLATPFFNTTSWGSTTPVAISWPRGHGKNTLIKEWTKSMKDLAKAAEKANKEISTGVEKLRAANDRYERKVLAACADAKVAVTQEKVYAFASANYLPEDYARRLLEEAYVDTILNEGVERGQE